MIFKGFRFGLMLQFAVGPVCFYILSSAITGGLAPALAGVAAVTLVDAVWVLLAGLGIFSLLHRPKTQAVFRVGGALLVGLYGLLMILGALGVNLLPGGQVDSTAGNASTAGSFLFALILTATNPATILFWVGVFGAKAANDRLTPRQLAGFGLGAILATPGFLALVAAVGVLTGRALPPEAGTLTTAAIGSILIAFAVKKLLPARQRTITLTTAARLYRRGGRRTS